MTKGIMEVTVVDAKGLKTSEFFGKADPYVVLRYGDEEHKSDSCKRVRKASNNSRIFCCFCLGGQSINAEWNEKFKFKVEFSSGDDQKKHKLSLKVMDHETLSRSKEDNLGEATIYLKDLFEEGAEKGKAEIGTQKYRIVWPSDKTYHGEIKVGVTFTTTDIDIGQ